MQLFDNRYYFVLGFYHFVALLYVEIEHVIAAKKKPSFEIRPEYSAKERCLNIMAFYSFLGLELKTVKNVSFVLKPV